MNYKLSDFDYNLPDELIATHPAQPRDHSRLLVLDKKTGKIEHRYFYDIVDYLKKGDVLVLNNSKVIPARLMAVKKETGGKVEVLLHKKLDKNVWQCLVGGKVKEGAELIFNTPQLRSVAELRWAKPVLRGAATLRLAEASSVGRPLIRGGLSAVILKNNHDGTWDLQFNKTGAALMKEIEKIGEMPLPPYIVKQRTENKEQRAVAEDEREYQTVFADSKKAGSVAAPTAGLHFTPELLNKIKKKGVKILEVTLYVGMGTFAPVKVEDFTKHKMHAEWAEIDSKTINLISNIKYQISKEKKGRVIAVGTTSARSLEACWHDFPSKGKDFKAWVDIFIYPGYQFKIVDAMITNFHLPKSTLLMLISALAGKKNIDKAYREAIKNKYRFYSYGDAMFIK